MEPLDKLHYTLFPYGPPVGNEVNLCMVPRYITVPWLEKALPSSSDVFVVEDLIDSIACLFITMFLLSLSWYAVYYVWNRVDHRFAAVSPAHKKWYVIANLSKSFLLGIQALSIRYWMSVYMSYVEGRYRVRLELKRCIVLYVVTDVVALFMVPKLPRSTFVHHVTTLLMAMVVWGVDNTIPSTQGANGIVKMIIIYGQCSTVAFLVNGFLAWRVVYPRAGWVKMTCHLALLSYLLSCTMNWSFHLVWLYGCVFNMDISILTVLYIVGLAFTINDDIKLISWLIKQQSPMASDQN